IRAASSRILVAICSWETSTPSMSGCRSSGCSAVVCIGSNGAVIAVAASGARGSSEREPVTPPFGDQPPGETDSALPAPVHDEPVERCDVAGGHGPGGGARGNDCPAQHPAADRRGQGCECLD